MFKRWLIVFLVIMLHNHTSFSQKIYQSVGVSGIIMNGDLVSAGKNVKLTPTIAGLAWYPRVAFSLSPSSSVSVGFPLTVGLGIINTSLVSISGKYLAYDIPFAIEYNDAFKAGEPGDELLGFFAGGGVGMTTVKLDSIPNSKNKTSSTGYFVRGGVRIGFPDDENQRGISIAIFHKAGFEFPRFKTTGISVMYDF